MTYDELMKSILTAHEQMLKHSIEANSVTLNGRKYGQLIENLPPNIKPTIFGMAVKADYALPDDYDFFVQYEPPQPKSRGDRFRSMSDEELAKELKGSGCPGICRTKYREDDIEQCYKCWLDWLRQEVDNG